MRAVGLHDDVIAVTSRAYATGCVLVRYGGEAFCIDSPVFPDELEILPAIAAAGRASTSSGCSPRTPTGTTCSAATRSRRRRWGRRRRPPARLINEPGAAQRELRDFDDEFYVDAAGAAVAAGRAAADVPGYVDVGEQTLELHPADGHTVDGMAIWIPWASVLVAGDYLSPVEIPMISTGGSVAAYLATLNRLEPLVEQADARRAGPRRADRRRRARWRSCARTAPTWRRCWRGDDPPLPLARRTKAQREIHAKNAHAAMSSARSARTST